jgi:hypothetical protein
MHQKKGVAVTFHFIPQLLIEIFDRPEASLDKRKIGLLLETLALKQVSVKDLMKIGEGSYLTLLIQISYYL